MNLDLVLSYFTSRAILFFLLGILAVTLKVI